MKKIYWIEIKKGEKIKENHLNFLKELKLLDWNQKNEFNFKINSQTKINVGHFTKSEWTYFVDCGEKNNFKVLTRKEFINFYF